MLEASATKRRPAASSATATASATAAAAATTTGTTAARASATASAAVAATTTVAIALVWSALLAARRAWLGLDGTDRRRRMTTTLAAVALLAAILLSGEATVPARTAPDDSAAIPAELAAQVAAPGPIANANLGGEAPSGTGGPFLSDGTLVKPGLSWSGGAIGPAFTIRIYTVRSGDTLTGIAARFGVSMMTLWWANDLSSTNVLHVGQRLRVPPVSGVIWVVREGDSLDSIAAATQADPDAIRQFNGLTSDTLLIGQPLMVPGGVGAPLPTPVPTPRPTPRPTAAPTPKPTPVPTPIASYTGIASWMSVDGLAARFAAGTLVRVCGSGGCIERRVTDWGPSDTSRLVDLYSGDFTVVCGCDLSVGLTDVRLDVLPD